MQFTQLPVKVAAPFLRPPQLVAEIGGMLLQSGDNGPQSAFLPGGGIQFGGQALGLVPGGFQGLIAQMQQVLQMIAVGQHIAMRALKMIKITQGLVGLALQFRQKGVEFRESGFGVIPDILEFKDTHLGQHQLALEIRKRCHLGWFRGHG